jgi:hypothetical protein
MIRPFVLFLTCLVAVVSAQEGSARSLRLLYVQAPDDAPASLFLVAGKEIKEVDLPRLSISTKRLALTTGTVRVYAASKAPTKDEPLPANAPFVDIPDGMNDPLVVLLPTGEAGPLAFRMLPVEFSRTKAPEGAVLWFNLSGRTLYSKLGTAQAIVAPRQTAIQLPPGKPGDVYHVLVDVAPEQGEEESVPLMRSSWVKEPGQRHLLFIVPDPDRKVPRIVAVPERMEPEPAAVKDAAKAGSGKPAK